MSELDPIQIAFVSEASFSVFSEMVELAENQGVILTTLGMHDAELLDELDRTHFDGCIVVTADCNSQGYQRFGALLEEAELPRSTSVWMTTEGVQDTGLVKDALHSGLLDLQKVPENWEVFFSKLVQNIRQVKAQASLKESEERYSLVLDGIADGLWDWDLSQNSVFFSNNWRKLFGLTDLNEEAYESIQFWLDRVHPEDRAMVDQELESRRKGSLEPLRVEHRMLHVDGSFRWVLARGRIRLNDKGEPYRFVGATSDVTHRKLHDPLTGMANRILFVEHLEKSLGRIQRTPGFEFAVLAIDLDRFQIVNDSLGHDVGDNLLIRLARRIEKCLRLGDIVARFGGDEFFVLLNDISDVSDATRVATRVQQALSEPFWLGEHEVFTSASIGIALSRTGYSKAEDVLRDSDTAMNRAKALGKARQEMFDRKMHIQSSQRLKLESELRRAIERQQLLVYYQPIVSIEDGTISAFEALVRWNHPEDGLIPPIQFVGIAEETGMVVDLDRWVFAEACKQILEWNEQFGANLSIHVNLSGKQFVEGIELVGAIDSLIDRIGLDPGLVKLEITESVLVDSSIGAADVLRTLRSKRYKVGLDDFGTGYSSLSYLHKFPVDCLKIDRSFVNQVTTSDENNAIVRAILAMASAMGFETVAEGVETIEQWELLKELSCDLAQGYYFSKPLPAIDAEQLLREKGVTRSCG